MKHLAFIVNFTRTIDVCLFENDKLIFKKNFRSGSEEDELEITKLVNKYLPDEKLDACFFFTTGSGGNSYLKELANDIESKYERIKVKWL